MIYDLHTHTNCSDGELSAHELADRAITRGVNALSITDHDTVLAYRQLDGVNLKGLTLIPGIEFSAIWQKMGVHIIGLNINPNHGAIGEGVSRQQQARRLRAEKIAERLEKAGLANALAGAQQQAGTAELSRPHFAKFMVESGFSKSIEQAFKKHLGAGKPGDIKTWWPTMAETIHWIRDSGGIPVLAHPHKYWLTRSKLIALLDDFVLAGGMGMEVLSGPQDKNQTAQLRDLSIQKGLLASMGSDFHSPKTGWCYPGMHTQMPAACKPVWTAF